MVATLEKYFDKLQVVEKSSGVKEAVATSEILCKETKPKFVCQWTVGKCDNYKDGFCSYPKYCSQKGKVRE